MAEIELTEREMLIARKAEALEGHTGMSVFSIPGWALAATYGLWVFYLAVMNLKSARDAGWKLQGFLEGARPGPDDKVSTGNFLGIGLRTDDFGDN